MRKGITLVEALVVILIIGILASLLFPVFVRARTSGYAAQGIEHGRQISMAMAMYKEQSGDYPEKSLDALEDAGLVTAASMFVSNTDRFEYGYAGSIIHCLTPEIPLKNRFSFEAAIPSSVNRTYLKKMESYDPNHGILALRIHGKRVEQELNCVSLQMSYKGNYYRFGQDTSAQRKFLEFRRTDKGQGHWVESFCPVSLYSDDPDACADPK